MNHKKPTNSLKTRKVRSQGLGHNRVQKPCKIGEEIRRFAKLGRTDHIFCIIIVDGEPAADGSVSACFPPALAEVGFKEPLAADVRKWADGKHVAKVKLIAGLLGLRLDELRQRDLQRRHRRYVITGQSPGLCGFVTTMIFAGVLTN